MLLAEFLLFGANLDEIKEVIAIAGTVFGAVATGAAAVWRWVWVPSSQIKVNIDAIHDLVQNYLPTLKKIAEEFKPNGGSSMKDALNRLEKNQQFNHFRTKILTNAIGKMQFDFNEKGECTWVSPKLSEACGMNEDKFLGNGWINAVVHNDRDMVWDEWQMALQQKRDFSLIFQVNEARPTTIKVYATALKDNKNQVIGLMGEVSA